MLKAIYVRYTEEYFGNKKNIWWRNQLEGRNWNKIERQQAIATKRKQKLVKEWQQIMNKCNLGTKFIKKTGEPIQRTHSLTLLIMTRN